MAGVRAEAAGVAAEGAGLPADGLALAAVSAVPLDFKVT
jgi:hypothetical protein